MASASDVRIVLGPDGADLGLEGGELALDAGLQSAVVASLWSDRRAEATDLPPEVAGSENPGPLVVDPRGWWAEDSGERFGSHLWLLARSKATPQTLARAEQAAAEALQWLIDEQIARSIEVSASYDEKKRLLLEVRVERNESPRWDHLWRATETSLGLGQVSVALLVA